MDPFDSLTGDFMKIAIMSTHPDLDSAIEIGTRYTRRLDGKHTLTQEEYRSGATFDDVIGRTTEIDRTTTPPGRYFQAGEIPFRSLVANVPANVICGSGKSASTHPCGLLRSQVGCMVVGEAAGTACALASSERVPVNAVNVERLQASLKAQGVLLGR